MAFKKIKFKHFQRPSNTDSRTFKDYVCFQGLSRLWKSGIKIVRTIKDFQGPARALHKPTVCTWSN